jgi:hypothetical protein
MVEAANWRDYQRHRRDTWLAWHIAALSRARRLPTLQRMLGSNKAKPLHGDKLERRRREHREIMDRIDVKQINEAIRGD